MSATRTQVYLTEEQRNKGIITGDLKFLIEIVSRACQAISIAIGKGSLGGVLGEAGSDNVQGEAQKKLDVLSNDCLLYTSPSPRDRTRSRMPSSA